MSRTQTIPEYAIRCDVCVAQLVARFDRQTVGDIADAVFGAAGAALPVVRSTVSFEACDVAAKAAGWLVVDDPHTALCPHHRRNG